MSTSKALFSSFKNLIAIACMAFLMVACGGGGGGGGGGSNTPTGPAPDTTAPYVTTANPAQNSTSSALTSVVLTFSEEVAGADVLANYALSGAGSGTLSLASLSYLNRVATLTFTGLVNNGAINIGLSNVADLAGNPLPLYTLTLYGTTSSPTQTALPASGTNNLNALASIEIAYSKEMLNAANAANYTLSGTAATGLSIAGVALKGGTTSTYVLTFSGTPSNGTLNISIGSGITDLVGNPLAGASITYTFDVTAPQISTTVPANGNLTNAAPTPITVTYSEPVNGKDLIANYALSGSAIGGVSPLSITSVTSGGTTQSNIYLTGTAVTGTLTLTVSNISDPAGNALTGSNTITINIDPVAPTRNWVPVDTTKFNALTTATVTYSEPVLNGANIASYSLIGNSKGTLAISGITVDPLNSNAYILSFTGSLAEVPTYKDVSIVASYNPSVTDLAGNVVASQVHWTVDQTPPTLLSVAPASTVSITQLNNVRVEFSEPMSASVTNPANYALSGPGVGSLVVGTPVPVSGNIYDIPLTGAPGVGSVTLTMTPSDLVGNAAAGSATYTFGTPATITTRTSGVASNLVSVATDGARIIAIASNSVTTTQSTDGGLTWSAINALPCGTSLDEIIFAAGKWTAIGGTNVGFPAACNSADGANWTNVSASSGTATSTYVDFTGIAHDGAQYVAVGINPLGSIGTQCWHSISADAQTWPATPSYCLKPPYANVFNSSPNGIHFANGKYFITGANYLLGPVLSMKADLANTTTYWVDLSGLTSAYKVIHDGTNYLVAGAGAGGTGSQASIGISADLSNASWSYVNLPDINTYFYDIAYDVTGGYIAVGNAGLIMTSPDGSNWTKQISVTSANLDGVLWDAIAANWVVVGSGGVILTVVP